jgi:3-oxoacyl-(acyl-carrier-protein) synthase
VLGHPEVEVTSGVAITGISVLSPFGVGVDALNAALDEARVAIEPAPSLPEAGVATIADFDPQRHTNVRGMRVYPRATQLEICAAALALADAGLAVESVDARELGLVTASSFSHLETLIEYDRGLSTVGMQRTNPTLMPLGLPSAPGAATALSLPAKAFSITLNDGGASGLSALGLGARLVAAGRARACVVAGAFSPFADLLASAARAGLVASAARYRVFDRDAAGLAFGEVAAALVLEPSERALTRGRTPLGLVRGEAARFAASGAALGRALGRAASAALALAKVAPDRLALACAGANGWARDDAAHVEALANVLGARAEQTPVIAPKASLGESFDPSGLVASIVALSALRARRAPPIARLTAPRPGGLRLLAEPAELGPGSALLTAVSPSGSCSALVLSLGAD